MNDHAQKKAFDEGINGRTYTGSSYDEQKAFEQGKQERAQAVAMGYALADGLSKTWGIIVLLRPVYVFLILYSPFIALGYLTAAYLWILVFGASLQIFVSDWPQIVYSLMGISLFSYIYFSIFEYYRGHMVENQKYNGHWRAYYLFFTLIRVMIPPVTAMFLLVFISGNKAITDNNMSGFELLCFAVGFTLVSFIIFGYKVSRRVNLFQPGGWAFQWGSLNNPYKRGEKPPRPKKNVSRTFGIMSFMTFYVSCVFLLNLVICLFFSDKYRSFADSDINKETLPVLLINLPLIWLCWMYTKNRADFFYNYTIDQILSRRFIWRLFLAFAFVFMLLAFITPSGYKTLAAPMSYLSFLLICYLMVKNKLNLGQ